MKDPIKEPKPVFHFPENSDCFTLFRLPNFFEKSVFVSGTTRNNPVFQPVSDLMSRMFLAFPALFHAQSGISSFADCQLVSLKTPIANFSRLLL